VLGDMSSLADTPWVFVLVGLSVLLDVFLPVLPSGILLISAVTAVTAGADGASDFLHIGGLMLCASAASCLGDLAAYRLAYRGGEWLDRRMARSRRLSAAQQRLGQVLLHGGGALVVLARFAPAGRSVVSLGAGAAHRRPAEFLPWSALAGLAWAGYGVGIGYLGGHWLGATWLATAVSLASLIGAGALASYVFRREGRAGAAVAVPDAVPAPAAPTPAEAG
jgi:membrane protein DedA with SNARE-associated domain